MKNKREEGNVYTVKQLARMIRGRGRMALAKKKVRVDFPSRVEVINGTIDLTEGANITLLSKNTKK